MYKKRIYVNVIYVYIKGAYIVAKFLYCRWSSKILILSRLWDKEVREGATEVYKTVGANC